MATQPISQPSSARERRSEADRIVSLLLDVRHIFSEKSQRFLEQAAHGGEIGPRQLKWLRDLREQFYGM